MAEIVSWVDAFCENIETTHPRLVLRGFERVVHDANEARELRTRRWRVPAEIITTQEDWRKVRDALGLVMDGEQAAGIAEVFVTAEEQNSRRYSTVLLREYAMREVIDPEIAFDMLNVLIDTAQDDRYLQQEARDCMRQLYQRHVNTEAAN